MNGNGHVANGEAVERICGGSVESEDADAHVFDKDTRAKITAMLGIGCDLRMAAWVVGRSPAEVKRLVEEDPTFVRDVQKGNSTFDYKHLQQLDQAARDKKNWRVSMWLLERLRPDRYEKQRPRTIKERQLAPLVKSLADALVESIEDDEQRAAVLARVMQTVDDLNPDGPLERDDGT